MSAKMRSAGNLSQNPQQAVYLFFKTNFTEPLLMSLQANFACIVAHPTKILGGSWGSSHGDL